jgi:protein ImuB
VAERLACVDVPELPLQLLLRRHPDWASEPVVVLAEDRPQAAILWANEQARAARVLPGLRYAAALALEAGLRADVVGEAELSAGCADLAGRLRRYTPKVERYPDPDGAGVYWLDAGGLIGLFPSLEGWASELRSGLLQAGYASTVVVGYTRFGTYALARTRQGAVVYTDAAQERGDAVRVPLARLHLAPPLREALAQLGVRTVSDFLRLPAQGVLQRFGPEALRLHAFAAGDLERLPLQPLEAAEPLLQRLELDGPEADATRLLFYVKRLLHPLLDVLAARALALAELALRLELDDAAPRTERLRPAAPTLEPLLILELVRLRLEALRLAAGVTALELRAAGAAATHEQLRLYEQQPRRDLDAAARALARVRAELGEPALVRASLREGHLPEARYAWEPFGRLLLPRPRRVELRPLVRRIQAAPRPLRPWRPAHGGRLDAAEFRPEALGLLGPYVVSGGWWRYPPPAGATGQPFGPWREVHREYHYAEAPDGTLLWVYYDRRRRRWFLHGTVE